MKRGNKNFVSQVFKDKKASRDKQGLSMEDLSRSYLAFDSYVSSN